MWAYILRNTDLQFHITEHTRGIEVDEFAEKLIPKTWRQQQHGARHYEPAPGLLVPNPPRFSETIHILSRLKPGASVLP